MNTGIIVLARMGSTRLPNKVLRELCGRPVLEHVLRRLGRVKADELIVATTVKSRDDRIAAFCRANGYSCFRGDEDNVLDRCIQAGRAFSLDTVVRLGADSPLVDGEVINHMLEVFLKEAAAGNKLEYLSNTLERTYPLGLDAEIFSLETLVRIDQETKSLPFEERRLNESNVVPYLHQNLDKFRTCSFRGPFDYSNWRLTLDTPEDFHLISLIYEDIYPRRPDFLFDDILDLLSRHPDWAEINSHVVPLTGFWTRPEREKLGLRLARGSK
ncbi:MAG: glycosyltransferase family protein [Thermodesulfobacteriota bacterium]